MFMIHVVVTKMVSPFWRIQLVIRVNQTMGFWKREHSTTLQCVVYGFYILYLCYESRKLYQIWIRTVWTLPFIWEWGGWLGWDGVGVGVAGRGLLGGGGGEGFYSIYNWGWVHSALRAPAKAETMTNLKHPIHLAHVCLYVCQKYQPFMYSLKITMFINTYHGFHRD